MSVNALQQQGKDFYKRKEYVKALECFDRAIGRLPSVQLLDHRAACHFKLNDLPAALKDAKKTIQLGREDPTGYLRAGKVLAKMEKLSVALEIYSHGLKSVKHVGHGYEALKKVYAEMQSQLAPPRSIDPLTVLPRELALEILDYLSFRQVVGILRVSREWNRFIQSQPDLWKHLDLTNARTKVKSAFISKCINTARNRLSEVTLNKLYDFDKAIAALCKFCPIQKMTLLQTGLQNLNLVNHLKYAVRLRELRICEDTTVSTEALVSLLCVCSKTLEVFECKVSSHIFPAVILPRLRAIGVVLEDTVRVPNVYRCLAENSPLLERIRLTEPATSISSQTLLDLSLAKHITHVDLQCFRPQASQIVLPPSVRALRLHVFVLRTPDDFFDNTNEWVVNKFHLPNLETLDLRIPGAQMGAIMDGFGLRTPLNTGTVDVQSKSETGEAQSPQSKIQSLSLSHMAVDDGFLGWSNSRLDELRHLAICHPAMDTVADFYDSFALAAATELRHLRSLDLTSTSIDGAGVKKVISTGASTLKELTLNDCTRLSRDAVDWARSKGIKVEHKTTSVASGRKVRY